MADPTPSARERLTRAAVLLFSGSVAAVLVLQAGLPGCSANTPTATTASPDRTPAQAPATPEAPVQPQAPVAAPPQPPATPTPPTPPANEAKVDATVDARVDPAKAGPAKASPANNANKPANPPPFLPASKAGLVILSPPDPPPQQAPPPQPQQTAPRGGL